MYIYISIDFYSKPTYPSKAEATIGDLKVALAAASALGLKVSRGAVTLHDEPGS